MRRRSGRENSRMDRIRPYVHDESRTVEWFWFTFAYLSAAECLAKDYQARTQACQHFVAPVIYNLRNGLELLLKFLALAGGSDFKALSHHDSHELFERVRRIFAELDSESIAIAAKALGVEEPLIAKHLLILVEKTEEITRKYSKCGFRSAGASAIDDPKNELFRYPSATVSSGAVDLSAWSSSLDVDELLEDVDVLQKFSLSVVGLFGRGSAGHLLETLSAQEVERS